MARADEPRQDDNQPATGAAPTRASLMIEHAAARQRRDGAQLGSDEFRHAAEQVARIEIAIAALEEPPPAG